MKVVFHKNLELDKLNRKFNDEYSPLFDEWDSMNETERLITDAAMFEDEAYVENNFTSLEEFAIGISEGEGTSFENVLDRLNQMIELGILSVED